MQVSVKRMLLLFGANVFCTTSALTASHRHCQHKLMTPSMLISMCTEQHGSALLAINEILEDRGRTSLAAVGEVLRRKGLLPEDTSVRVFVGSQPGLTLSGRPNNLQVSLTGQTREAALVRLVSEILNEAGAISIRELKIKLSERGRSIPGLLTLLRRNADTFHVNSGVAQLTSHALASEELSVAAPPMVRLQSLGLGAEMSDDLLPNPGLVEEVVLLDLDNKAHMLEKSAAHALRSGRDGCQTLVLGFCCTSHNPRLSQQGAEMCRELSDAGWLRILAPIHDTKNAADFVMAFWAGWLHERLPAATRFIMHSTDIHLDRTICDLLAAQGRCVVSNPESLHQQS